MESKFIRKIKRPHKSRLERIKWNSGGFRVEEFRVPLLKGMIQPPTEPLVNAKEVTLDLNVQYLAGGGAGLLPVKLRSEVDQNRFLLLKDLISLYLAMVRLRRD